MKPKHIHKYKKINLGSIRNKYEVYKCLECSSYTPINQAEGLECRCNRCGQVMKIGKAQLKGTSHKPMTWPHCDSCIRRKKSNEIDVISAFLEGK